MDKLSGLFDAKQFAVAFDAVREISSAAQSEAAMMWLEGGVAVAGAGFAWGHGRLKVRGTDHLFSVSSLSIADVAAASIYATGRVMGLKKLSDFSGHYRASGGVSAMTGGAFASYLQNEHDVLIMLTATDASTRINRSVERVRIRLRPANR